MRTGHGNQGVMKQGAWRLWVGSNEVRTHAENKITSRKHSHKTDMAIQGQLSRFGYQGVRGVPASRFGRSLTNCLHRESSSAVRWTWNWNWNWNRNWNWSWSWSWRTHLQWDSRRGKHRLEGWGRRGRFSCSGGVMRREARCRVRQGGLPLLRLIEAQ
jgi:hypothetical protein